MLEDTKKKDLNIIYDFMNEVDLHIRDIQKYIDMHFKDIKMIKKDNHIIGMIIYYKENEIYFLDAIYIKEEYRNLGIGHNILNKLIKNQKKSIIQLWVFKDNIKAIKLYKNLGFEIIKETKKRYLMEIN